MQYLAIAILLNVVISAIFKMLPGYKVDLLQAVVANYCVCVITGCLFIGHIPFNTAIVVETWFPWAILMGAAFISIFNLIGYNTHKHGITTTTIANKLSLIIPVIFSFFLYGDHMGAMKVIGIILALPAVYLTTRVWGDGNKREKIFWPVLLFIGSGLLDTLMQYVQFHFLSSPVSQAVYSIYCFAIAAIIGLLVVAILFVLKRTTFQWRSVIAGICIGIPNYFSIYFFIRALNSNFLESSATIPVMNIGILVASALTAILFFRERANVIRITGLVLSVVAIFLIAFG
jgi:drug/metabolite transporter (DMT)-like permease